MGQNAQKLLSYSVNHNLVDAKLTYIWDAFLLLNPKQTGDGEQGTSCPYLGNSPLPIPQRHGRREEGTGQEEEEKKKDERGRKWGQTHHTGYLGRLGSFWMVQSKDSILREKSGLCYHPGQHLTPISAVTGRKVGKGEEHREQWEKQQHECEKALKEVADQPDERRLAERERKTEMNKKDKADSETEGEILHKLGKKKIWKTEKHSINSNVMSNSFTSPHVIFTILTRAKSAFSHETMLSEMSKC